MQPPTKCPNCESTFIRRITTDWTKPHYVGYVCDECVQMESAIFPESFICYEPTGLAADKITVLPGSRITFKDLGTGCEKTVTLNQEITATPESGSVNVEM